MIQYSFFIHRNDQLNFPETPRIKVEPPYDVLGDLSNIPDTAIPKIIKNIEEEVMTGKKQFEDFGWHRVACTAEAKMTWVEDMHAEYFEDSLPHFQVPTSEILQLLEEWHEYYENWKSGKEGRNKT